MTFDHDLGPDDLGHYELGPEEQEALRRLLYDVVPPPTEEEGAAMFDVTMQAGQDDHDASPDGDGSTLDLFPDQPGWWDPDSEFSHHDPTMHDHHHSGDGHDGIEGYDGCDGHTDGFDYGVSG